MHYYQFSGIKRLGANRRCNEPRNVSGIVLARIIGVPLGIGAFIVGLSCAIATGYLKDNSIIKKDTIIGIVFSGIFVLTINRHKSADYRYHYYITVYSAWYRLPFLPH